VVGNPGLDGNLVMSPDGDAPDLDLIALGRASVDLYGEQVGGRLEDMGSFAK
jgi:5-dehydro-2-deoxygluconokinase